MLSRFVGLCAVLVSLVLSACGGGGGGGGGGLNLTLLNTLNATYRHWDFTGMGSNPTVLLNARVTGSTNVSTIYVIIADANNTFVQGQVPVTQTGSNTYRADLSLNDLGVGTRTGTLEVRLCADVGCASELAADSTPYNFTVQANPTLRITASQPVDGQALVVAPDPMISSFGLPNYTFQGLTDAYGPQYYVRQTNIGSPVVMRPSTGQVAFILNPTNPYLVPMEFYVADGVAAGEYSGTLTFDVCLDPDCNQKFNGTSSMPYELSVGTGSLTALNPAAGAPEWQTLGANAQRTSYVPMTVDKAALAPRWRSTVARVAGVQNFSTQVVTSGGNVYVTFERNDGGAPALYALDEADGSPSWDQSFPAGSLSPLLSANGKVYISTIESGTNDGMLRAYAADTGTAAFEVASSTSVGLSLAPLGDDVLIREGSAFNLYDGATGAGLTEPACLATLQANNGFNVIHRPPVSGDKVYLGMGTGLEVVDFGAAQSCTHFAYGSLYAIGAPLLTPAGRFMTACSPGGYWTNYSFESFGSIWSIDNGSCNGFSKNVAVANGVAYTIVGGFGKLEARNEATGALLWQWGDFLNGDVLVTDNVVFVGSGTRVYAVDMTTHRPAWILDVGTTIGAMALSPSGVLYLVPTVGFPAIPWYLLAINVR